jgi:hypothetical protein
MSILSTALPGISAVYLATSSIAVTSLAALLAALVVMKHRADPPAGDE